MSRQILNRTRRRPVIDEPLTREVDDRPRALTEREREEVIAHDVDRLREREP